MHDNTYQGLYYCVINIDETYSTEIRPLKVWIHVKSIIDYLAYLLTNSGCCSCR